MAQPLAHTFNPSGWNTDRPLKEAPMFESDV
ncbi:hypothetical protein T4C_951 [Trichinella pseudospiralis]|uniref:Uncharacterized protein n=1 Tax=Trichinella pseudospiralis TaxID=6337 RepID=A0A0V1GEY4_TRIPS|nr:hypothetical protein T4C_951 [Trichinella pseudospiralis]